MSQHKSLITLFLSVLCVLCLVVVFFLLFSLVLFIASPPTCTQLHRFTFFSLVFCAFTFQNRETDINYIVHMCCLLFLFTFSSPFFPLCGIRFLTWRGVYHDHLWHWHVRVSTQSAVVPSVKTIWHFYHCSEDIPNV